MVKMRLRASRSCSRKRFPRHSPKSLRESGRVSNGDGFKEAPMPWGQKPVAASRLLEPHANDPDFAIRMVAFDHLSHLSQVYGDLPASVISPGFMYQGEQVALMTRARGIFKPKQMKTLLSITTVVPRSGRTVWYDDQLSAHKDVFESDDSVTYAFQKGAADSSSNRLLKDAMQRQIPVVYFLGIVPAVYKAIFPVFISNWREDGRTVQLVFGDSNRVDSTVPATVDDRRYGLRTAKQRLHQTMFRKALIDAYAGRCAISGLPEPLLLDAAHIVADTDPDYGHPVIPNGLPLSKLHHAAFDSNLIGIDGDCRVHVSEKLMSQKDGPLLDMLQGLRGASLLKPRRDIDRPDPDRLDRRFQIFKSLSQ
jgi:putative restriction endonuclease